MSIVIVKGIFAGKHGEIICKAGPASVWVRLAGSEALTEIYNGDYAVPVV